MLFELVDTLQKKRRLLFVAVFVATDFWLLTLCTHVLQAHRPAITARIHNGESSQASPDYQGNTLFDELQITAGLHRAADITEVGLLRATVAATDGFAKAEHGLQTGGRATAHGMGVAAATAAHVSGAAILFTARIVAFPFVVMGRCAGSVFGVASRLTHIHPTAVIQPKKDIAVPVITPEQAQQAALIQKDTLSFEPVKPAGAGGACDSGAGNGGYPIDWCSAPMDSLQTVSYSSDHINRECTSYAYWYFATVEGHTDFHVTGNANRWAYTSNYPTHTAAAIGAIAIETAGAYGHVAIVQALPGQTYEGKVVPAGYVLVSEMNYDWHGHFRYSYSPLSKFSAYIYP